MSFLVAFALAAAGPPEGWTAVAREGEESRFAPTAEEQGRGYVVFSRHYLWKVYRSTVPSRDWLCDAVELRAARGEYEPAIFAVHALGALGRVRVETGELVCAAGRLPRNAVDVRVVREVARVASRKERTYRRIPKRLERFDGVEVPAGETVVFWLTVHVPRDAAPGDYSGRIRIAPQRAPAFDLRLRVRVHPFELPAPPKEYMMRMDAAFHFAGDGERPERNAAVLRSARKMYADMKEHGMTACSPKVPVPDSIKRGADGSISRLYVLEASLALAKEVGLIGPCVWDFEGLVNAARINLDGPFTDFQPERDLALLREIVEQAKRKAKENGWPEVVFCPINEPEDERKQRSEKTSRLEMAEVLLETVRDSGARTGLAMVRELFERTPEKLAPLKPLVDVWVVDKEACTDELGREIAGLGAEYRMYHNGTTMYDDALRSRFPYGFYAWAAGLEGVGGWTYPCYPHFTDVDFWDKDKWQKGEYLSPGWEPVPTISWECIREGIDDARYLSMLEGLVETVRKDRPGDARRAEGLLRRLKERVNLTYSRYRGRSYGEAPRWLPEELDRARAEMADEAASLLKEPEMARETTPPPEPGAEEEKAPSAHDEKRPSRGGFPLAAVAAGIGVAAVLAVILLLRRSKAKRKRGER